MSITMWIGPMFAGKTTALINAVHEHLRASNQSRVFAVKYAHDRRYGATNTLVSHDGRSLAADAAVERLSQVDVGNATVVAVDEGQFFDDLAPACDRWAQAGRHVLVAALVSDYNREPFASPAALIAKADRVVFTAARCLACKDQLAYKTANISSRDTPPPRQVRGAGPSRKAAILGSNGPTV